MCEVILQCAHGIMRDTEPICAFEKHPTQARGLEHITLEELQ